MSIHDLYSIVEEPFTTLLAQTIQHTCSHRLNKHKELLLLIQSFKINAKCNLNDDTFFHLAIKHQHALFILAAIRSQYSAHIANKKGVSAYALMLPEEKALYDAYNTQLPELEDLTNQFETFYLKCKSIPDKTQFEKDEKLKQELRIMNEKQHLFAEKGKIIFKLIEKLSDLQKIYHFPLKKQHDEINATATKEADDKENSDIKEKHEKVERFEFMLDTMFREIHDRFTLDYIHFILL